MLYSVQWKGVQGYSASVVPCTVIIESFRILSDLARVVASSLPKVFMYLCCSSFVAPLWVL